MLHFLCIHLCYNLGEDLGLLGLSEYMFSDAALYMEEFRVSERSKVPLLPSFPLFDSVQRNFCSILEEISGGDPLGSVWCILYII